MVKVLEVTRIERRAVVELTNGGYLDLLMQTEIFCANSKKIHETKWRQFIQKFSLTQASEFQILKEILQLLESQSSVQIIANENNTNASIIKSKFKVYRINFY
jgi:hypothetical protein